MTVKESSSREIPPGDESPRGIDFASSDSRLCRLCLMAAIVFAFGKEALMFI